MAGDGFRKAGEKRLAPEEPELGGGKQGEASNLFFFFFLGVNPFIKLKRSEEVETIYKLLRLGACLEGLDLQKNQTRKNFGGDASEKFFFFFSQMLLRGEGLDEDPMLFRGGSTGLLSWLWDEGVLIA